MAESQIAFHMADNNRLYIVMILSSGGGVADMPHSDVSFAQTVQPRPVKDFANQAVSLQMMKHAVAGYRDPAAFLPPVLQGIESEIYIPGNRFSYRRPDPEDTAFLMHEAYPPKKGKGVLQLMPKDAFALLINGLYYGVFRLSMNPAVLFRDSRKRMNIKDRLSVYEISLYGYSQGGFPHV